MMIEPRYWKNLVKEESTTIEWITAVIQEDLLGWHAFMTLSPHLGDCNVCLPIVEYV